MTVVETTTLGFCGCRRFCPYATPERSTRGRGADEAPAAGRDDPRTGGQFLPLRVTLFDGPSDQKKMLKKMKKSSSKKHKSQKWVDTLSLGEMFRPEDITVKTGEGRVTVTARKGATPGEDRGVTRVVRLPSDVNPTSVKATLSEAGELQLVGKRVGRDGRAGGGRKRRRRPVQSPPRLTTVPEEEGEETEEEDSGCSCTDSRAEG